MLFSRTPLGLRHSRRGEGCAGWGRAPERRQCSLEWAAGLQPSVPLRAQEGTQLIVLGVRVHGPSSCLESLRNHVESLF